MTRCTGFCQGADRTEVVIAWDMPRAGTIPRLLSGSVWGALSLCAIGLDLGCGKDTGQATDDVGTQFDAGAPVPTSDAGGGGDDGGPHTDCGPVTSVGRCASHSRVEVCVQATGGPRRAQLSAYECKVGERCDDTKGMARCVLESTCASGATACLDASTLHSCAAGEWLKTPCEARCVDSTLGAACAPSLSTRLFSGTVRYDVRRPNVDLTDWTSDTSATPAAHFGVLSYAGDDLFDATYTDDAGAFSVRVPAAKGPADRLVIVAAGPDANRRLAFAVADPGYAASTSARREPFDPAPDPSLWSWSMPIEQLAEGGAITISQKAGSGAAHVFDTLQRVFRDMEAHFAPEDAQSVVVWVGIGTAWNCGACSATLAVELSRQTFLHQVWFDGSQRDQAYWSDAVTAHELGHYVMAAYGYPASEGGPHFTGSVTNPGQAWTEGFATFFSSLERDSPLYYDKQDATFFWLDLDARRYIDDLPWARPLAGAGLFQLVDENEVAAMLRATELAIGDKRPILRALASDRMRVPPFERGYKLRTWSDPDHPEIYEEDRTSLPFLPDYFDALRCDAAITAEALDLITEPSVHYPYPSQMPLCR